MPTPRRAFTLMELLIVVAVIAVLVGIVTVSIRGVRDAANRTESLSALRQMGMGYNLYAQEHNGRLLPGYIGSALMASGQPFEHLAISVGTGDTLTDVDMQSYVWRLAPYVDDHWETFFEDTSNGGAMTRFTEDYQRLATTGGGHEPGLISEFPSFGLNSIFVGGDSVHGGVTTHNPWTGTQPAKASTRLSHALNPTKLIVFAPAARGAGNPADAYADAEISPGVFLGPGEAGVCELRAPYLDRPGTNWTNQQWTVGASGRVTPTGVYGASGGMPIARSGKDMVNGGKDPMPVVHLDGSTAMQPPVELTEDMRRWSQRKGVE